MNVNAILAIIIVVGLFALLAYDGGDPKHKDHNPPGGGSV